MRRLGLLLSLAAPLAALFAAPAPADDPPRVRIRPPGGIGPAVQPGAVRSDLSDEEALKQAGLSAGEVGPLLEYLRVRTLTEGDQTKIGDVIKRFGADDFEERVKATEEVERFGPAAIGPL